jgi:uncharacterized protein YbaA (DUF1428 family)
MHYVDGFVTPVPTANRDAGWKKIMADPRMQPGAIPVPFDGKRLVYGGFQVVLRV